MTEDPNWTPKEPRRPLQPGPKAFGPSHSIKQEEIEKLEDEVKVDKLIEDTENGHSDQR